MVGTQGFPHQLGPFAEFPAYVETGNCSWDRRRNGFRPTVAGYTYRLLVHPSEPT